MLIVIGDVKWMLVYLLMEYMGLIVIVVVVGMILVIVVLLLYVFVYGIGKIVLFLVGG